MHLPDSEKADKYYAYAQRVIDSRPLSTQTLFDVSLVHKRRIEHVKHRLVIAGYDFAKFTACNPNIQDTLLPRVIIETWARLLLSVNILVMSTPYWASRTFGIYRGSDCADNFATYEWRTAYKLQGIAFHTPAVRLDGSGLLGFEDTKGNWSWVLRQTIYLRKLYQCIFVPHEHFSFVIVAPLYYALKTRSLHCWLTVRGTNRSAWHSASDGCSEPYGVLQRTRTRCGI